MTPKGLWLLLISFSLTFIVSCSRPQQAAKGSAVPEVLDTGSPAGTGIPDGTAMEDSGTVDGGGGYQYPNSHLLLKIVKTELASQIEKMHDEAFAQFPENFRRKQIVEIVRNVLEKPTENKERENANGEKEGLMFDYIKEHCVNGEVCAPRIAALQPFFDAYKGLPVQQIQREKVKPEIYLLTVKDLRRRLIHEVVHLIGVGVTGATDLEAEILAERFERVLNDQYVVCEAVDFRPTHTPTRLYEAFIVHPQSGHIGIMWNLDTNADPNVWSERKATAAEVKKLVLDVVHAAAGNSWDEKRGFNPAPHPLNYLADWQPAKFSIEAGVIEWTDKPSEEMDGMAGSGKVDLNTGKGSRESIDEIQFYKDGSKKYIHNEFNCRVVGPVISLENLTLPSSEVSDRDHGNQ